MTDQQPAQFAERWLAGFEALQPFVHAADKNLDFGEFSPESADLGPDALQAGAQFGAVAAHLFEHAEHGGGQQCQQGPSLRVVHHPRIVADRARGNTLRVTTGVSGAY